MAVEVVRARAEVTEEACDILYEDRVAHLHHVAHRGRRGCGRFGVVHATEARRMKGGVMG